MGTIRCYARRRRRTRRPDKHLLPKRVCERTPVTRTLILILNAVLALGLSSLSLAAEPVTIRIGYIPVAGIGQLFVIQGENWA